MLSLTFCQLFLLQLLLVIVNCDPLVVNTKSGRVQGVVQQTLLSNKPYLSFKGIPFAEPPIGKLRYRVPVPITPWPNIFQASNYGNACLVIDSAQGFPLNNTQNEDCLNLNVYTPVLGPNKKNAKKAVMFFIYGGGFTEGDNTNGFYGPDFLIDNDVVFVISNYRLGPWGFASFDLPGFTGNMGFKDQQLALEWTKNNIENFGGDPNLITIFGESAGGAAVHLQILSDRSRKSIKRAIPMSGVALANFALYKGKNHVELIKEIFDLNQNASARDVLEFMNSVPAEVILQKTPSIYFDSTVGSLYWAAVIEDKKKAENPFLTQNPRDIYKTSKIDVDVMFGFNSAEALVFIDAADPYNWIPAIKNFSIGLPFVGLNESTDSPIYRATQKEAYQFYFGDAELLPIPEIMDKYVQLVTDVNFVYPLYESLRIQSTQSKAFAYQNDVTLNLNFLKINNNFLQFYGMSHFEDIVYIFRSNKYESMYAQVLANQTDLRNRKTLNALRFESKTLTDFAKTGSANNGKAFSKLTPNFIHITNDGLKSIIGPRIQAIKFWDRIYNQLTVGH